MRQQINLHQPIFRRERKTLSALTVAATLGVVAVALTGFSLSTARGVERLAAQVAQLTEQQQNQQAQWAKVLSRQAHRSDVEARVKALAATLSERTQALQVLQSGATGQTSGFASRMEALARRHVNGLWIDGLAISGTHSTMSIIGGSVDADIVPVAARTLRRLDNLPMTAAVGELPAGTPSRLIARDVTACTFTPRPGTAEDAA